MTLRDLLLDTLISLWTNKLRTALTMFGIAWGIISIILMVAAGEGLRVGQKKVSDNFGKDIMIIFSGRTSLQAGGNRAGRSIHWEASDAQQVLDQSPACQWVLPEFGTNVPVRSSHNSGTLLVTGSWPPFAQIRTLPAEEGRFYNWEDLAQARRMAFIGSDAKKQLFGARQAVGQTIRIGDFPYIVI